MHPIMPDWRVCGRNADLLMIGDKVVMTADVRLL